MIRYPIDFIKNYNNGLSINASINTNSVKWVGNGNNHNSYFPEITKVNFTVGQDPDYTICNKNNFIYDYFEKFGVNLFQDSDWITTKNAYCLPSNNENLDKSFPGKTFEFTINGRYTIKFEYLLQIRNCYRNYRYVTYDKDGRYSYVINDIANPATQYLIYGQ